MNMEINSIMWNKNSDQVLTSCENAKIFDVKSGEWLRVFKGDSDKVSGKNINSVPVLIKQPGVLCPEMYPLDSFPPKAPIIPDIFTVAVETVSLKVNK